MNIIPTFVDRLHQEISPEYTQSKKELRNICETGSFISLAMLATSIAFEVLSPTTKLYITLPICYFAYNFHKTFENMKNFADQPTEFVTLWGLGNHINEKKFRDRMTKDTFCFEWFTDFVINDMKKQRIIRAN